MKKYIVAQLAHFFSGVMTVLSVYIHPILAIITFLCFIIYELDEDWHISDGAFKDIRYYGIGLFLTISILYILRVLTG